MTTRSYMGAWVVWLVAIISLALVTDAAGNSPSPAAVFAYDLIALAATVMFAAWLGASITLGMQRAWRLFAIVFLLHMLGLGIIGMVAYATARLDEATEVVLRPTAT